MGRGWSSRASSLERLLHSHRLNASSSVVGGVLAGTNGGTGSSGRELRQDEVANRAGLLGQVVQVRSSSLVGLVGQFGGLLSHKLGVVSQSSVDFVLVLGVQKWQGESQNDGDDGDGVQGQVGGDKVQDVRDTGGLQGQLDILGIHDALELGLEAGGKSAHGRQDRFVDNLGVQRSMDSVLGDEALASDQLTHVLGSGGNQKTEVRHVEKVIDDIDLEENEAKNKATEHLACDNRVLPGKQGPNAASTGGRSWRVLGANGVSGRHSGGAVEVKRLLGSRHGKKRCSWRKKNR